MTQHSDISERTRLLRGYVLDTLSASERARVDRDLAESPEWRDALDTEREALALLDALPPVEAPATLAGKTMATVREAPRKRGNEWIFYVAAAAMVFIVAAILLPATLSPRETSWRPSSQNNLKQLGLVFKMYAGEHRDQFPPLTPYPGVWMFDIQSVYPEYLTDLSVLIDPSLPDASKLTLEIQKLAEQKPIDWEGITRIAARSYTYPGWMVTSEKDVRALDEGVKQLAKADLGKDLTVGDVTLHRLKEGIERFMITDLNNPSGSARMQSEVPLIFESTSRSKGKPRLGANVLYMDGHVDFIPQNSKFPVTDSVQKILKSTP